MCFLALSSISCTLSWSEELNQYGICLKDTESIWHLLERAVSGQPERRVEFKAPRMQALHTHVWESSRWWGLSSSYWDQVSCPPVWITRYSAFMGKTKWLPNTQTWALPRGLSCDSWWLWASKANAPPSCRGDLASCPGRDGWQCFLVTLTSDGSLLIPH